MPTALEILFEQAGEKAQETAKELARTRQGLAQARDKLQMLEGYAHDCIAAMHQKTMEGLTAYELRSQAGYVSKVEDALAQQRNQVEFIERTEHTQIAQWQAALADEKKYKALLDRQAAKRLAAENKRDQKMNDEFAARIYRTRTAGESA